MLRPRLFGSNVAAVRKIVIPIQVQKTILIPAFHMTPRDAAFDNVHA